MNNENIFFFGKKYTYQTIFKELEISSILAKLILAMSPNNIYAYGV